MSRKPLIIYVSGAPGSGKNTLATKISNKLYIPHVSSDLVHGGIRFTEGKPNDRKASLHNAFVPLLIEMARKNISFVVDHVLQRDMSEQDVIQRITPYAEIMYIHTHSEDAITRHLERELARHDRGRVLDKQQLVQRSELHHQNLPNTAYPLDLGVPLLEVNTVKDYNPSFEEIIKFIEQNYQGGSE